MGFSFKSIKSMRWVVSSSDWSEENLGFRHCSWEGRESALLLSLSADTAPSRGQENAGGVQ